MLANLYLCFYIGNFSEFIHREILDSYVHLLGEINFNDCYAVPYTVKHSREKTFAFRVENGYSLENFCVSMLVDLYSHSTRS